MYSAGMDSSVIAHRQRSLSNYSSREEIVAWNVFSIRIVSTTLKARQRRKVSGLAFPLSLFLSFSMFLFHVIYLQVFVPELKQCKTRQLLVFRLTVVGNLSASVTKASKNCFTNPSICRMPKDTAANCVQYRRD